MAPPSPCKYDGRKEMLTLARQGTWMSGLLYHFVTLTMNCTYSAANAAANYRMVR